MVLVRRQVDVVDLVEIFAWVIQILARVIIVALGAEIEKLLGKLFGFCKKKEAGQEEAAH